VSSSRARTRSMFLGLSEVGSLCQSNDISHGIDIPWERLARLLALLDQAEEGVNERSARQAQGPARAQRGARVAHKQPERVRGRVRDRAAARHQGGHRLQATLVPNKTLRMGSMSVRQAQCRRNLTTCSN